MAGTIKTYQKCPRCDVPFPSSKGDFPIICTPCRTQPTKYFIELKWKGKNQRIYYDKSGKTMHSWNHVVSAIGEMRGKIEDHKNGDGTFDPGAYKKQATNSFSDFWSDFIKDYEGATAEKLGTICRHHFVYFHDMQMRDITALDIKKWWRDLQEKGLSPKYCNDIQTWLRTVFNEAQSLDVVEKSPRMPDFLDVVKPDHIDHLTEDEQLAVLDAIPEHDRPIFDFLFITGVRVNEACALRRSDIDYKIRKVFIRNTVKRDGSIGVVKNKKERRIPLEAVLPLFNDGVVSITGFAFTNKWGRRYSDDYLRDTFDYACDKAGVERIKLKNATRHSFGMGLLKKGYDIWQTSKIMGHSDIKITEHYAEMLDKEMTGAYGRGHKMATTKKSGLHK